MSPRPQPLTRGAAAACPHHHVLTEEGVYVSRHAIERLRRHHPSAALRAALASIAASVEVSAGFIAPLLGRSLEAVRDRYLVTADRRGVWVVARGPAGASFPWSAVTYLRFGPYQQHTAERLLAPRAGQVSVPGAERVLDVEPTQRSRR